MDTQWKICAVALAAVIAGAGAVVACSSDPMAPQAVLYVAHSSAANEVPPVALGASGTATFTLTGKTLSYVACATQLATGSSTGTKDNDPHTSS